MTQQNYFENDSIKHIYMIGIGGISMSGIALILNNLGYLVSGSDATLSKTTDELKGITNKINMGHHSENITTEYDLVIYTAAIKNDNPELSMARELNIPCIERAELLGLIMKKYKLNISISGTHGKTTSTAMLSSIMLTALKDPTIHIGGVLDLINGSTRVGCNNYFITEACEYVESFLHFFPHIGIILNIEEDHLDYFKDIENIKDSFLKFTHNIDKDGYLVANIDDENISSILPKVTCNVISYGINNKNAKYRAENISFNKHGNGCYDLIIDNNFVEKINLCVPGIHNISNSLSCIAAAMLSDCDMNSIKKGLENFCGTHRRFQFKGEKHGIKVIDDYAHHPTEIHATLTAAKMIDTKDIWCVFQPHTYTRTKSLFKDFIKELSIADNIIIADIYAAREKNPGDIHSSMLADEISKTGKNVIYLSSFEKISDYLNKYAKKDDMILTMGAGDIFKVGEMFLSN